MAGIFVSSLPLFGVFVVMFIIYDITQTAAHQCRKLRDSNRTLIDPHIQYIELLETFNVHGRTTTTHDLLPTFRIECFISV